MTIQRLHHAQITIPAGMEAEGRAFYVDFLGLREVAKPDTLSGRGGFWLEVGDQQVHVGTEDGVDRLRTKAHLAYAVDDIDLWQRRCREQAIPVAEQPPIPGFARFEIRDPFGNRVEFIQPLTTHK